MSLIIILWLQGAPNLGPTLPLGPDLSFTDGDKIDFVIVLWDENAL